MQVNNVSFGMKLKDEFGWEQAKANNQDYLGKGVVKYAERWANLTEQYMENGDTFNRAVDKASHEADTDGITGLMYVAAVNLLSHVWKYGDFLRQLHNMKYGVGLHEKGIANPALVHLQVDDETLG